MPVAKKKKETAKKKKQSATGASPRSGMIPPPEHRFKKGNPGGPGRKPLTKRQKQIRDADKFLTNRLGDIAAELVDNGDYDKLLNEALKVAARRGGVEKILSLNDYLDGRPIQRNELSGPGGAPIKISWPK